MEISPSRELLSSIQETSRDQLHRKGGEHTRCGENDVCRGPKVGKKHDVEEEPGGGRRGGKQRKEKSLG